MDEISRLYETGQFSRCISELNWLPTYDSVIMQLIVEHNLAVSKWQLSYVSNEASLRTASFKELGELWSKLMSFSLKREHSQLTLACACNLIYCTLDGGQNCDDRAFEVGCRAVELVLCQHGGPLCVEVVPSNTDSFSLITQRLIKGQYLEECEILLLLYLCSILSCLDDKEELVSLMVEISQLQLNTASCNNFSCFLLCPVQLIGIPKPTVILGLSTLIRASSRHKQEAQPGDGVIIQHQKLLHLYNLVITYTQFHRGKMIHSLKAGDMKDFDNHLKFSLCLIRAAQLASDKNYDTALRFLSFAAAGELGRTKACAIATTYSANLFRILGDFERQIEALQIAQDALNECPTLECSFHRQLSGFLFSRRLPLLHIPSASLVRYQLARSLLEAQRYKEAAAEYEKLAETPPHPPPTGPLISAFQLKCPSSDVVIHETVLAWMMTTDWDRALDAVESASNEDFLLFVLHAEIRLQMGQHRRAAQLLSRAIGLLNSPDLSFPIGGCKGKLKAKILCRLAQVLDAAGSPKDAFHQLRVAVQLRPNDSKVLEFYQTYARKLQVDVSVPNRSFQSDEEEKQLLKMDHDWAFHCFIRDGQFIPFTN